MSDRYDALVVGARCAGAATAALLARQGLRVLLIDRSRPGRDALSTHALMRPAVFQLARLGVLDTLLAAGTPPIRRTTFQYGDEVLEIEVTPRDGVDALVAPRRKLLDAVLVEAAAAAGADVRFGASFDDVIRDLDGRVIGATVRSGSGRERLAASLVIGADGRHSRVAERVGAPLQRRGVHFTGTAYAYVADLGRDSYRWVYREGAAAGVIPTNDGLACVFGTADPARFAAAMAGGREEGWLALLRATDRDLADEVSARPRATTVTTFPGAPGHLRQAVGPGWALVGDSGYFKDPLTAHGITDALRDAALLCSAIGAGGDAALGRYQTQRDELSERFLALTDAVASMQWDLTTLQQWHRDLNREMRREEAALRDIVDVRCSAA